MSILVAVYELVAYDWFIGIKISWNILSIFSVAIILSSLVEASVIPATLPALTKICVISLVFLSLLAGISISIKLVANWKESKSGLSVAQGTVNLCLYSLPTPANAGTPTNVVPIKFSISSTCNISACRIAPGLNLKP